MNRIARLLRACAKLRFKIFGLATIKDIETVRFMQIIEELIAFGWKKTYEYNNYDAWVDYGKVILKKDGCQLKFEWDNWTEGSIEGPLHYIEMLAAIHSFEVTEEWRWAEYDE